MCAEPDKVRSYALQLAHQNANRLRALWNLKVQKFFGCHHVSQIVAQRIQVIHAVRDDYALLILLILKELLHPGVKVADVGR